MEQAHRRRRPTPADHQLRRGGGIVHQIHYHVVAGPAELAQQPERGSHCFVVAPDLVHERKHRIADGEIGPAQQEIDAPLRIAGAEGAKHRHAHQDVADPFHPDQQNPGRRRELEQVPWLGRQLASKRPPPGAKQRPAPAELQRLQYRRQFELPRGESPCISTEERAEGPFCDGPIAYLSLPFTLRSASTSAAARWPVSTAPLR